MAVLDHGGSLGAIWVLAEVLLPVGVTLRARGQAGLMLALSFRFFIILTFL